MEMSKVRKNFDVGSSDGKRINYLCTSERGLLLGTVGAITGGLNKEAGDSLINGEGDYLAHCRGCRK